MNTKLVYGAIAAALLLAAGIAIGTSFHKNDSYDTETVETVASETSSDGTTVAAGEGGVHISTPGRSVHIDSDGLSIDNGEEGSVDVNAHGVSIQTGQ